MSTEIFFKYVDIVGTMQLSNDEKTWRGIDKSRIEQCPYPLPSDNDLNYTKQIVLEIIKSKNEKKHEIGNNLQNGLNSFFLKKLNLKV